MMGDQGIGSARSQPGCAEVEPQLQASEPAAAFTPGPWKVVEYGDGDNLAIHSSDLERVCFMATPGDSPGAFERIQANAQAISALPGLIEAARDALDFISSHFENLTTGEIEGDAGEPLAALYSALAAAGDRT